MSSFLHVSHRVFTPEGKPFMTCGAPGGINIYPCIAQVIVNTIDLEGKTDAEMMALVEAGKLDQLNLNELLFVAESIAQDNATKNIVLAYAAEKYNDARAYNNLGIVLTEEGRTLML